MKDFRKELKELAKAKGITSADMYQLCLFKAITAKSATSFEDRVQIAYNLVTRAFTPITNKNKLYCSGYAPYQAVLYCSIYNKLYTCLESPEEISLFQSLNNKIKSKLGEFGKREPEKYTYIFVRADMPREYQLVQTSHVTFKLGAALQNEGIKADELNFVVCHAPDESGLLAIGEKIAGFGYKTITFTEPDLNSEITALASWPIEYRAKHCMKEFNLLRFGE